MSQTTQTIIGLSLAASLLFGPLVYVFFARRGKSWEP